MQVIDASSIVLAWDIYPISQFPKIWNWMDSSIQSKSIVMADPNFIEVKHVSPDCHRWLSSRLTILPVDNAIVTQALKINQCLGITNGQYHLKGVDENDIMCIATAKVHDRDVISDEAPQASKPNEKRRYKIPAVCQIVDVGVNCIQLNQLIRTSGQTF